MIIRSVKPEDAEGVQKVFYCTWLATYPSDEYGITKEDIEEKFKNSFTRETLEKISQQFKNLPKDITYLVAEQDNKVIGLCRIFKKNEVNELSAIYVLPEHQRQGVGRALWLAALQGLDQNKETIVHVVIYNTQAQSFYASLGFIDTGKRFSDPAFVMPITKNILPEMEMKKKHTS